MSDEYTNEKLSKTLRHQDVISPEVLVMIDVTRANTEQLVQIKECLNAIQTELTYLGTFFRGKDGFDKELNNAMSKHMDWLWLKFAGATSILITIILGITSLLKGG